MAHHDAFRKIAEVDRTVLGLNLLLLMGVSLIPFPTALVAEHLTDGLFSINARTATAAYAVLGMACTIPWVFMWAHLRRYPGLLKPLSPGDSPKKQIKRSALGVVAYAISLVAALALPAAALTIFIAAPAFYVLTARGLDPSDRRSPAPVGRSLAP